MPLPNPGDPVGADSAARNNQPALPGPQAPRGPPPVAAPAVTGGFSAPPASVPPAGPGPAAGGGARPDTVAARRGLKGAGTVYTPAELGETPEQWGAIQNRLQNDPTATVCRTCFYNCGPSSRRWCSRFGNENAGTEACQRCERCESLPNPSATKTHRSSFKGVMHPLGCSLQQ